MPDFWKMSLEELYELAEQAKFPEVLDTRGAIAFKMSDVFLKAWDEALTEDRERFLAIDGQKEVYEGAGYWDWDWYNS